MAIIKSWDLRIPQPERQVTVGIRSASPARDLIVFLFPRTNRGGGHHSSSEAISVPA